MSSRRPLLVKKVTRTRPALLLVLSVGIPGAVAAPPLDGWTPTATQERRTGSEGETDRLLEERALVIFGADTVDAEVARSADDRSRGLMFRDELAEGTGMLFVFPDLRRRSFWMRDTRLALDLAFIDEDLRVVAIEQLEPESLDSHESPGPVAYALEVPQGWFAQRGIEVGAVAEIVFR